MQDAFFFGTYDVAVLLMSLAGRFLSFSSYYNSSISPATLGRRDTRDKKLIKIKALESSKRAVGI